MIALCGKLVLGSRPPDKSVRRCLACEAAENGVELLFDNPRPVTIRVDARGLLHTVDEISAT